MVWPQQLRWQHTLQQKSQGGMRPTGGYPQQDQTNREIQHQEIFHLVWQKLCNYHSDTFRSKFGGENQARDDQQEPVPNDPSAGLQHASPNAIKYHQMPMLFHLPMGP